MFSNLLCVCYMNLYAYYAIYIYIYTCSFFLDPGSGVLGLKLAACCGMPRSWNSFDVTVAASMVSYSCNFLCQVPCGWRVASRSPAQWQARQFR